MNTKNLKIRLSKILSILGIVTVTSIALFSIVSADTYVSTYDTDTIALEVANATYQAVDAACTTLAVEKSGGGNLQSTTANRYGTGSCTVTVEHNDPQEDIYISYSKATAGNLTDAGGTNDIDNINNASDCTITTDGTDTTNEQFGYRISGVTANLLTGVQTDAEIACSGIAYNATAVGSNAYLFDVEYTTPDTIINSTSTTCFQSECQFDVEAHANIIYSTVPAVYSYNAGSPTNFTTTVTVSTTP